MTNNYNYLYFMTIKSKKDNKSFIKFSVDANELVIDNVVSYTRRAGIGTDLVKQVIALWASEYSELELTLWAYPQDDSIELESLIKFYQKLGFSVTDDSMPECGVEMKY